MKPVEKIYLVGDEDAPKTNSWEYMTPSEQQAEEYKEAMGPKACVKEVELWRK